jgi:hypothetical protein
MRGDIGATQKADGQSVKPLFSFVDVASLGWAFAFGNAGVG